MGTNCRCGHQTESKNQHPCHGKGHTCRKPATEKFYQLPNAKYSLAGMMDKFSMESTWSCDECWAPFAAKLLAK